MSLSPSCQTPPDGPEGEAARAQGSEDSVLLPGHGEAGTLLVVGPGSHVVSTGAAPLLMGGSAAGPGAAPGQLHSQTPGRKAAHPAALPARQEALTSREPRCKGRRPLYPRAGGLSETPWSVAEGTRPWRWADDCFNPTRAIPSWGPQGPTTSPHGFRPSGPSVQPQLSQASLQGRQMV